MSGRKFKLRPELAGSPHDYRLVPFWDWEAMKKVHSAACSFVLDPTEESRAALERAVRENYVLPAQVDEK